MLEGIHLNLLAQAAVFAVNLAVTPILVRRLKPEGYALYTLMWTLLGYLMILNAGTGDATQKYSAQYRGKKQSPVGGLLRATAGFQAAMAVVGGLALLLCRGWISTHWLHIEGPLALDLPRVFACVAIAAPGYFLLQFCIFVLYGEQRYDACNLFQALQATASALGAAALLAAGCGIREIAAFFALVHALLAAGAVWLIRASLTKASTPLAGEWPEFIRFSGKSLFAQAVWIAIFQGDRLVIGSLLPLTQMGYYVIASSLAQKFNTVCGTVHATAFPIVTELYHAGEKERLRRFYLKSTELALFIILPVSILSFILMPQFTTLWLGTEFSAASTWPFRFLLLANFAYLATLIPGGVSTGAGAPEIQGYGRVAKLVLLLILWPLTIKKWGILGAGLSFAAADWLVAPVFMGYVHRKFLDVSWGDYWEEACWRPVVAGMGLAALGLFTHEHVGSWLELISFGGAGMALFLAIGYWFLDDDAKSLLWGWAKSKGKLAWK